MKEKLEKLKRVQDEYLELNGYPEKWRLFLDGYDVDEKTLDMNIELIENTVNGIKKETIEDGE